MMERKFNMIEAQELKNGCVQIVNMHRVYYCLKSKLVCGAMRVSSTDPAPGHPH
jgi:hypothetical protein